MFLQLITRDQEQTCTPLTVYPARLPLRRLLYSVVWMLRVSAKRKPHGPVSTWVYRLLQACTAFEIFCAIHFIQCFANKPHDEPFPKGLILHTYPFTLMIVALWVMSAKNCWWFLNHEHEAMSRELHAMAWSFEAIFFVLSFLKVLIHLNFFFGDAMWEGTSSAAVTFSRVTDILWMLMVCLVIPAIIFCAQHRIGDRVQFDISFVKVHEGDYDWQGRPLAGLLPRETSVQLPQISRDAGDARAHGTIPSL